MYRCNYYGDMSLFLLDVWLGKLWRKPRGAPLWSGLHINNISHYESSYRFDIKVSLCVLCLLYSSHVIYTSVNMNFCEFNLSHVWMLHNDFSKAVPILVFLDLSIKIQLRFNVIIIFGKLWWSSQSGLLFQTARSPISSSYHLDMPSTYM